MIGEKKIVYGWQCAWYVHKAHTVKNYKDQNEVTSMEWPAQSPDLDII